LLVLGSRRARSKTGYAGLSEGFARWMRSSGAGWRVAIRCWAEKSWDVFGIVLRCKDRATHARVFS
jgi:hypothetical protein